MQGDTVIKERSRRWPRVQSALPVDAAQRRAAYAKIIAQQEATLLRAALRMCGGDGNRAQDLVQDALVRGYEAYVAGRFAEGTNARAWLLSILTHGFINDYNRRKKWQASVDIDTLTAQGEAGPESLRAAGADQPDRVLMAATLDEPLERALASLSEEMRACVVLVDVEGMEYAEAATALQIPIGTVRSRLARARLQLHALLLDYARDRRRA